MNNTSLIVEPFHFHSPYQIGAYICAWLMVCITVSGVLGNALTFLVFISVRMRSSINVLLAGLSLIDSAVLIFGTTTFVPLALYSYYGPEWFMENRPTFAYIMVFVYPLAMIAQTASVWTLILITLERFLAVCHPFVARVVCTVPRALTALFAVTVFAICYNVCRFWEQEVGSCEPEGVACPKDFLRVNYYYSKFYMVWMYLIFMFIVPFSLLVGFNLRIVFVLRMARQTRRRMSRRDRHEHKTTEMMLVVILLFLLCNSMLFALTVIDAGKWLPVLGDPLYYFLTNVSNVLVEVNSAANLPIYYKFGGKFRREFQRIYGRFRCLTVRRMECNSAHSENSERDIDIRTSLIVTNKTAGGHYYTVTAHRV